MPSVRRLIAILAADVAGYSRLMGADEEGTHERLKAHLGQLVAPKIEEHRGRTVKNTGRPVRVYRVCDRAVPIGQPLPGSPQPLPLPDKPSIAVLPFANLSGDPEQEYFADGMVDEIITALSRIKWLFVIADNSSFA